MNAHGDRLRLTPALKTDAGRYACAVEAPDGAAARRHVDLQVRSESFIYLYCTCTTDCTFSLNVFFTDPPKISPFIFSPELTEGSAVQILCGVSAGDKPLYFSWFKDGAPLPAVLQVVLDRNVYLTFSF